MNRLSIFYTFKASGNHTPDLKGFCIGNFNYILGKSNVSICIIIIKNNLKY